MKTISLTRIVFLMLVVIALTACVPTATPESTNQGARTAEPSASPVPPSGKAYEFNGLQVTIPAAVASGATGQVVPAAQGADLPEFGIHPAYTEIKLTGYPAKNEHFQGMIRVLPVADYEKISEVAKQRVQAMRSLLTGKPAAPEGEIPMLPVQNAAQVLRTQVQYLSFREGAGVRFVTMYSQGLVPATNQEVFYTFQGLTSDGAYWVSAILPVNTAFLAADASSAGNPPAGGIAFPSGDALTGEAVTAYYGAVADKLNTTPAGQFTPKLEALDAMMQSLRVTTP